MNWNAINNYFNNYASQLWYHGISQILPKVTYVLWDCQQRQTDSFSGFTIIWVIMHHKILTHVGNTHSTHTGCVTTLQLKSVMEKMNTSTENSCNLYSGHYHIHFSPLSSWWLQCWTICVAWKGKQFELRPHSFSPWPKCTTLHNHTRQEAPY